MKQKAVAEKLGDFGGNLGKTMVAAGYSSKTARNPQKLTQSKGWLELMEDYLPNKLLLRKHKELLKAKRIMRTIKKGKIVLEKEEIDNEAVAKGLDLAYKVKGLYKAAKYEIKSFIDEYSDLTDEELDAITVKN